MSDDSVSDDPRSYPQQELTSQDVHAAPRRPWLWVLMIVAVLVIGTAVVVVVLNRTSSDRDAYCDELRTIVGTAGEGEPDLAALFNGLERLADLAPDEVEDDWATVQSLFGAGFAIDPSDIDEGALLAALTHIADDARTQCDVDVLSEFQLLGGG